MASVLCNSPGTLTRPLLYYTPHITQYSSKLDASFVVSVVINALSSSTTTQLSNFLPEKGITFIVSFFAKQLIHAYFFPLIMRTFRGVSKFILCICGVSKFIICIYMHFPPQKSPNHIPYYHTNNALLCPDLYVIFFIQSASDWLFSSTVSYLC